MSWCCCSVADACPGPLAGLAARAADGPDDIDAAAGRCRRLIVVGSDADLAAVLTRLLRADRLDVEVGHATGWRTARRARRGTARRVPLIRDETGHVIVGAAEWRGENGAPLRGEAVVDDTQLFDGEVAGVRIEPTHAMPGLRACRHRPRQAALGGRAGRSARHDGRGRWCATATKRRKSFADLRFIATRRAGCW